MKIIDNFLHLEEFNTLNKLISGNTFPWYKTKILPTIDEVQFAHIFFIDNKTNSQYFDLINFFTEKLEVKAYTRIKANILLKTNKIIEHGLHTDVDFDNSKTAVYYCNTNNGYTRLVDGTTVNSIENRMLIFDSKTLHTGSTCTDAPFRTVINFNYF
jgi:hypothetical protein